MYPGMAKAARDEGFGEIADWFETLAKAERSHANRFQKALESLEGRSACLRHGRPDGGRVGGPGRDGPGWREPCARVASRRRPGIPSIGAIRISTMRQRSRRNCIGSSTSATAVDAASACASRSRSCSMPIDASPTLRTRRCRQEGLLAGRRALLPVRPVLHDQVSVRSAASLERGLPASDAARQGGARAQRASCSGAKVLSSTDAVGQHRRHPGGRRDRQRGQPQPPARKLLDKTLGVHPQAPLPRLSLRTARAGA